MQNKKKNQYYIQYFADAIRKDKIAKQASKNKYFDDLKVQIQENILAKKEAFLKEKQNELEKIEKEIDTWK